MNQQFQGRQPARTTGTAREPELPLPSEVEVFNWEPGPGPSVLGFFSIRLDGLTLHNCRWMYSSRSNSEFVALPARKMHDGSWQKLIELPRSWEDALPAVVEDFLEASGIDPLGGR